MLTFSSRSVAIGLVVIAAILLSNGGCLASCPDFLFVILLTACWLVSRCPPKIITPCVACNSDSSNLYILSQCRLAKGFSIPGYLANHHLQTVFGFFRWQPTLAYTRSWILNDDGGLVSLDWLDVKHAANALLCTDLTPTSPVMLILPCELSTGYCDVSALCHLAVTRGYRPAVFNPRGCHDNALLTPRLPSFGCYDDLHACVEVIKHYYPFTSIVALGDSYSAYALLTYASATSRGSSLSAIFTVSAPYDAHVFMKEGLLQPYDAWACATIRQRLRRHVPFQLTADASLIECATSFQSLQYASHSNVDIYRSYGHYAFHCISKLQWCRIAVPTMLVNSCDDPVLPQQTMPHDYSDRCIFISTDRGGHCGFVTHGTAPYRWVDRLAVDYFDAVLQLKRQHTGHRQLRRVRSKTK